MKLCALTVVVVFGVVVVVDVIIAVDVLSALDDDVVLVVLVILKLKVQSNSVITNSTGLHKSVRYNREFVIAVNVYVVK